ncbi:DUF1033 family protein [Streptococcus sp. NLN76]|uniref:DUF1033 family protein n=1 Tax=Streptococcus sp. NLN76 TaxID=2822800 RepID=UPI0018AC1DB3|nr:DUF1033 family protein [Streptococcus sp. NLN76]MBF8970226.1 DUF1033 family protein [Streptococcus sp. NLN76]
MYQVVELYGDCEPWWLTDDWQEDTIRRETFKKYTQALTYFEEKCRQYKQQYPEIRREGETMAAFWKEGEERWCEECGDYLQQYHSLALVQNGKILGDLSSLTLEGLLPQNAHCQFGQGVKRA